MSLFNCSADCGTDIVLPTGLRFPALNVYRCCTSAMLGVGALNASTFRQDAFPGVVHETLLVSNPNQTDASRFRSKSSRCPKDLRKFWARIFASLSSPLRSRISKLYCPPGRAVVKSVDIFITVWRVSAICFANSARVLSSSSWKPHPDSAELQRTTTQQRAFLLIDDMPCLLAISLGFVCKRNRPVNPNLY